MGLFDFLKAPRKSDGEMVQVLMPELTPDIKAGPNAEDILKQVVSSFYSSQGSGWPSEFTWKELVASYSSWVYTSIDKIAKTIAGAPKRLYAYKNKQTGKYVFAAQHKAFFRSNLGEQDRKYYLKEQNVERIEITEHPLLTLLYRPNTVDSQFIF
jgi:hypothetical protein